MKKQITFKYACIYAGTFLSGVCFAFSGIKNDALAGILSIFLLILGASASLLNNE